MIRSADPETPGLDWKTGKSLNLAGEPVQKVTRGLTGDPVPPSTGSGANVINTS